MCILLSTSRPGMEKGEPMEVLVPLPHLVIGELSLLICLCFFP